MGEITLTLKEADELYPALHELANEKLGIPAKQSYRIGKMYRKLKKEIATFQEARLETIKRLGEQNEDDDTWTVKKEHVEEYTAEIEQLLEEEITMTGVAKIEIDDIEKIDIKPASIAVLEPLIDGLE